jgi:hypothetical protein
MMKLARTTLVNNDVLAQVALELGLNQFIRYVPTEALLQDGRAHAGMLADTFEGNQIHPRLICSLRKIQNIDYIFVQKELF